MRKIVLLAMMLTPAPLLAQVQPQMSLDQAATDGCRRLAFRDPYNSSANKTVPIGCAVAGAIDLTASKVTASDKLSAANADVPGTIKVGTPSFDPVTNAYVPNNGGIRLGYSAQFPSGMIWLKQEGYATSNEEASLAMYPIPANRWAGISIAPSGQPWNIPGENVTSLALQLINGASEERLTLTSKWFGTQDTGYGEYRIAPYKNGSGRLWPLTLGNNNARQLTFDVDGSTIFSNETYSGYPGAATGSRGDTLLTFKNPTLGDKLRLGVRPSTGFIDWEALNGSNAVNWSMRMNSGLGGPRIIGVQPSVSYYESDQPADNRLWFTDAAGGRYRIMATNDGQTAFGTVLDVTRSGATVSEAALLGTAGTGTAPFAVRADAIVGRQNIVQNMAQPGHWLYENDQAVDNRRWIMDAENGHFRVMAANDANTTFGKAIEVGRSDANVTEVALLGSAGTGTAPFAVRPDVIVGRQNFVQNMAQPAVWLYENDQAVDSRRWIVDAENGRFRIMAADDATTTFGKAIDIGRSSTNVTEIVTSGHLLTATPNANNIGSATTRFLNIYANVGDFSSTLRTNGNLVIDTPQASAGIMRFRSAGAERWAWLRNMTAESGADAGSDLVLNRYNDAGGLAAINLRVTRSNGNWALEGSIAPMADNAKDVGAPTTRYANLYAVRHCYTATVCDLAGAGSPEGSAAYAVGSTYRRTDGGAGTTFYVKESGAGATGWVAK